MPKYTNESLMTYIYNGYKENPILLRFTSSQIHTTGDDIWGSDRQYELLYRQLIRIYSKNSQIWAVPIPLTDIQSLKEKYRENIPTHYMYLQLDQWYIRPDKANILFMTKLMNFPGEDHIFSGDGKSNRTIFYRMVPEESEEYKRNIRKI